MLCWADGLLCEDTGEAVRGPQTRSEGALHSEPCVSRGLGPLCLLWQHQSRAIGRSGDFNNQKQPRRYCVYSFQNLLQPFEIHNTLKRSALCSHFTVEEVGQRGKETCSEPCSWLRDRKEAEVSCFHVLCSFYQTLLLNGALRAWRCLHQLQPGGVPALRGSWALWLTKDS